MKVICVEAHASDAGLLEASIPAMEAECPYAANLGENIESDTPDPNTRPRILSPEVTEELVARPIPERISEMDRHGIDLQVVSYSDMFQYAPLPIGVELIAKANDRLADIVRKHPNRLAGFSALPWQDPDAALRELDRTVGDLGLRATLLSGRPGKAFLDDPVYKPILARLEQLRVPLSLHPGYPDKTVQKIYYQGFEKQAEALFSIYGWGWHNESGIQVLRLILSGTLDRYPDLRIISGHWGEMVPFFLQRLDDSMPRSVTGLSRSITQTYVDQIYVTPSGMLDQSQFKYIHEVVGPDRIMYSGDYPYLTLDGTRRFLEGLPVSEAERVMIASGNAERLLLA